MDFLDTFQEHFEKSLMVFADDIAAVCDVSKHRIHCSSFTYWSFLSKLQTLKGYESRYLWCHVSHRLKKNCNSSPADRLFSKPKCLIVKPVSYISAFRI